MASQVASKLSTATLRAPFRIASLAVGSNCKDKLKITWEDGEKSIFPNVWLRSSVRDEKFFNSISFMYPQIEYTEFLRKKQPILDAKVKGEDVEITWEDHKSSFNASWMRANDLAISKKLYVRDIVSWNGDAKLPNNYHFLEKEEKSEKWINDIKEYGFALFQGTPTDLAGIQSLLLPVGRLMQRNHPTDGLHMRADPNITKFDNDSYSSDSHPFHIDAAYYDTPPRLSCLLATEYEAPDEDTANLFVDSVKVTEDLQREEPEAYKLLTTRNMLFSRRRLDIIENNHSDDVSLYHIDALNERPMISYDDYEKTPTISLSNKQLGFKLGSFKNPASANERIEFERLYDAYKLLEKKIYDPEYQQKFVLKKGDAVVFNNLRLIHSRGTIHPSTKRSVLLGFIAEQRWQTRMRILAGQKSGLDEKWLYGCSRDTLEILANRMEY